MLTQAQVEERMYLDGRDKMVAILGSAEESGRADAAPYAGRVFRDFVLPLADLLKSSLAEENAGVYRAQAGLLRALNLRAVAYLTVRHVLNACLQGETYHRSLGYALGRTVHRELVLAQFEDLAPDLYHTLSRDLARRMSRDERHRLTVFKLQAKKQGLEFVEWPIGARDQVGLFLLFKAQEIGLVDILPVVTRQNYKREQQEVLLTEPVRRLIGQIRTHVVETNPIHGPCVERPLPWTSLVGGGWHTPRMRSMHRLLVKAHPSARPRLHQKPMPIVLAAVNALQDTAWAVNRKVLDVVLELARRGRRVGEVETDEELPKPPRPDWADAIDKDSMTEAQAEELRVWKRAMVQWYESRKLKATRYGRFYTATRQAATFQDYPKLHFVYFLDSRGRAYPMTYGLNPQGSDLQKALLHAAEGLPLDSDDAVRWFLIHGANKAGFDSAPLAEREQWVRERAGEIRAAARDPLGNQWWLGTDNPLQFLAWCFEFDAWQSDPSSFVSRLPVSMDGSCNGLQHFSAMLRDPVGGEATNLTARPQRSDVYLAVAAAATRRMTDDPRDDDLAQRWRALGIARSLVKRPVMTTPYGITFRSAGEYIVSDFLKRETTPFEPHEFRHAADVALTWVWPAIGDVVVAARQAMDWLAHAAKLIADNSRHEPDPVIEWHTPSGFIATQTYFEPTIHRIRTHLAGMARIRVLSESDDPDLRRHGQSFAPNFVHSMDAAHMHRVAARCAQEGISFLAMIHDDYGTLPAHAQRLFTIIREEFVAMYAGNPLVDLRTRYPFLPPPPAPGSLDLSEVLRSDYFFS